jgi:hypothetical protein
VIICPDFMARYGEDTLREGATHIYQLATRPKAELGPVGLAAIAPLEGLVAEHQPLINYKARSGKEEPLALTDIRRILATVAGPGADLPAGLGGEDLNGLQGLLGLT